MEYIKTSKKIEKEEINLLLELVIVVRYVIPRSNGLNKAYHAAKDWLLQNGYIELKK